jgi:hypothetical protein
MIGSVSLCTCVRIVCVVYECLCTCVYCVYVRLCSAVVNLTVYTTVRNNVTVRSASRIAQQRYCTLAEACKTAHSRRHTAQYTEQAPGEGQQTSKVRRSEAHLKRKSACRAQNQKHKTTQRRPHLYSRTPSLTVHALFHVQWYRTYLHASYAARVAMCILLYLSSRTHHYMYNRATG